MKANGTGDLVLQEYTKRSTGLTYIEEFPFKIVFIVDLKKNQLNRMFI